VDIRWLVGSKPDVFGVWIYRPFTAIRNRNSQTVVSGGGGGVVSHYICHTLPANVVDLHSDPETETFCCIRIQKKSFRILAAPDPK
jgi:hypothetical protein